MIYQIVMQNHFIRSKKKVENILLNLRHKQQQSKFELPRRFSIQQPTREHLLIGESTRRYLASPYNEIESLLLDIEVYFSPNTNPILKSIKND